MSRSPDAPATGISPAQPGWQFWIDRGGTFTDLVALRPDGELVTTKLLSEDPHQYQDAAVAGMRKLLNLGPDQPLPLEAIEAVKMGTTVATNALLERQGERTALLITRGFGDQLRIGYQSRPDLFSLNIQLPELLYSRVVEVDERVGADGTVITPLDVAALQSALDELRRDGFRALAVVYLHAWRAPHHEIATAEVAASLGFDQISVSHEVSPLMKVVPRGHTTVADAYLSPVLARYIHALNQELGHEGQVPLYFMKSNGGLVGSAQFRGKDSVLSGPAGGIVGMVRTGLAAGFTKLLGFDMGGTSTDVSHFSGTSPSDCERVFDTTVAGVPLQAPTMDIHTIAAGGGSTLHYKEGRFQVGPGSAGSRPGPVCYRQNGPLALTDCNVLLGRIQPEFFPKLFGPNGDGPLDTTAVRAQFEQIANQVAQTTSGRPSAEQVAEGYVQIAVAKMASAIQFISVQRGHDISDYTLVCFGGAGGQHACAVAEQLGVSAVLVHPLSGVLSAYGMGLADITAMRERAFEQPLSAESADAASQALDELSLLASTSVQEQGVEPTRIRTLRRIHLKYQGTDTALVVNAGALSSMRWEFEKKYRARFSFLMPNHTIAIESVSVEAIGDGQHAVSEEIHLDTPGAHIELPGPQCHVPLYCQDTWRQVPVHSRSSLRPAQPVAGPALVIEDNATIVVDEGWTATARKTGELILKHTASKRKRKESELKVNPVTLELCSHRFRSIAEQMGFRLANTAHSVNIKERLDFSCALFDANGDLVANAPHVPVHLGSMSASIKTVIAKNQGAMKSGDVYALNDPYNGGTHLPDITAVMPIFSTTAPEQVQFYVAARGHHADVGGITPGSMPPTSRTVEEEGVLFDNFRLLRDGQLAEEALRRALSAGPYPARNPNQNLADLRAQVAACEKGKEELLKMVSEFGLATVQAYMGHVQDNAEQSVRRLLETQQGGSFEYPMDDGARICVDIRIDARLATAHIDFSGTSPERPNNFNAPQAVVHAAVLYVFRTLIDDDIPLNAGCLRPLRITIPEASMLSPRPPAATVAGNVETSQCIVDALYGALGVVAASQGTMNNFTFGDDRYQYYETLAGGSGAGPNFHGAAAVQTHMTNSRLTDPEVLESRFPVRVEEHSIRQGSGGKGHHRGGDGALRRIRFLKPLTAAIVASHRRVSPYGVGGGQAGQVGASWVERANGTVCPLDSCAQIDMQAGDLFVTSTPSGGGYGSEEPSDR